MSSHDKKFIGELLLCAAIAVVAYKFVGEPWVLYTVRSKSKENSK